MAGNRYGRNQKRRHREEAKRLRAEIDRLGHVARDHHEDKLRHLRARERTEGELIEWARRIIALLGPESAFTRKLHQHGVDADLFTRAVGGLPLSVSGRAPVLRPGTDALVREASRVIECFAVYAYGQDDRISRAARFEIVDPDGRTAMMVDMQTLRDLKASRDSQLQRYLVANMLGPWLAGEVRP